MQIAKMLAVCPAPACVCVCAPGATAALAATSDHVQLIRSSSTLPPPHAPSGLIFVIDWTDRLLSRLPTRRNVKKIPLQIARATLETQRQI